MTITERLYKEFRAKHPRLKKMTLGCMPNDGKSIIILLKGGERMVYDGELQRAWFIKH